MKLPRDLDGAQVVRALGRLGFETVRQVGSHIQLRKASLRVTVPAHRPIRAGTLKSILRQAEIELDDLIQNL